MQESIYSEDVDPEKAWNDNSQDLVVAAKVKFAYSYECCCGVVLRALNHVLGMVDVVGAAPIVGRNKLIFCYDSDNECCKKNFRGLQNMESTRHLSMYQLSYMGLLWYFLYFQAYAHYLTVIFYTDIFTSKDRTWEPRAKAVMIQLCEFYIVNGILDNTGTYLQVIPTIYLYSQS